MARGIKLKDWEVCVSMRKPETFELTDTIIVRASTQEEAEHMVYDIDPFDLERELGGNPKREYVHPDWQYDQIDDQEVTDVHADEVPE